MTESFCWRSGAIAGRDEHCADAELRDFARGENAMEVTGSPRPLPPSPAPPSPALPSPAPSASSPSSALQLGAGLDADIAPQLQPPPALSPATSRDGDAAWFWRDPDDFSVVLGGPLYQFFLADADDPPAARSALPADHRPGPASRGCRCSCWRRSPGVRGQAPRIPFLADADLHVGFLLSLPLLVYAERLVHARMRPVIGQFFQRRIIRPEQRGEFEQIIASSAPCATRSWLKIACWRSVWSSDTCSGGSRSRCRSRPGMPTSPPAAASALPGRASTSSSSACRSSSSSCLAGTTACSSGAASSGACRGCDLHLIPTHPDRAGGLLFLQGSAFAFTAHPARATTVLLAGLIANRIFHDGARLPMFKYEIAIVTALMLLLAFGPLSGLRPAPRRLSPHRPARVRPPRQPLRR